MGSKRLKSKPNISIRIDKESHLKAKIAAVKANVTLGHWLEAAIREKTGRATQNGKLTKAEIARRLGVTKSYISQISHGKKRPSKRILIDLFKNLN
jgi:hypothetical protein